MHSLKNTLVLFVVLASFTHLYSMEQTEEKISVTKPSLDEIPLTKETTWLVHKTRVFPKNGIIVAGAALGMDRTDGKKVCEEWTTSKSFREQARSNFSGLRNTVHWSVNSLVYPHEMTIKDPHDHNRKTIAERSEHLYCILEPLSSFEGISLQGYWQDVYHLGSHKLSSQALILVPETDEFHKELIGSFDGTIVPYNTSMRETVERVLIEHKAPVTYPQAKEQSSSEEALKKHDGDELVIINNDTYSRKEISDLLHLNDINHTSNELGKLHIRCLTLTLPARSALHADYLLSTDSPSSAGKHICSYCQQSAQDASVPHLQMCARCKVALYCSTLCQKKHWLSHKKRCKDLEEITYALHALHHRYIDIHNRLHADEKAFLNTTDEINRYLTALRSLYSTDRETQLLDIYQQYIHTILNLLYAPEEKSGTLRENYKVETVNGFLRFMRHVRDMVAPLAILLEEPM